MIRKRKTDKTTRRAGRRHLRVLAVSLSVWMLCAMLPQIGYAESVNAGYVQDDSERVTEATPISAQTEWTEGWYVAQPNEHGTLSITGRVRTSGDVKLILADGVTLTVQGGIEVSGANSLTIYGQTSGSGKLIARATADEHAGIGGGSDAEKNGGHIAIHGGSVTADGGKYGAGIGGGNNGSGGTIEIFGGEVTASGDESGAAIGGGNNGSGGTIAIHGGSVTANGGQFAAGIGGGNHGDGGNITLTGGTLRAESKGTGAGIGGGDSGNGGEITISGGEVAASGDESGAGIGGGKNGNGGRILVSGGRVTSRAGTNTAGTGAGIGGGDSGNGGEITISGGEVTASGHDRGAGIGGGNNGSGGTITISGGSVTSSGGTNAAGIGGGSGENGGSITLSGGTIRSTGGDNGAGVGGGSNHNGGEITILGGQLQAVGGRSAAGIGNGFTGKDGKISVSGGQVTAIGGEGGAGIGSGSTGSNGTIEITNGSIDAVGGKYGAGIGGGFGENNSGGDITISGGLITAGGGQDADGIGQGKNGSAGSFSTQRDAAPSGRAILFTSGISDRSKESEWRGLIFRGDQGIVYGNVVVDENLSIPAHRVWNIEGRSIEHSFGKSLRVPAGASLTIRSGKTLTIREGLYVSGTLIAEGAVDGAVTVEDGGKILRPGANEPQSAATDRNGRIYEAVRDRDEKNPPVKKTGKELFLKKLSEFKVAEPKQRMIFSDIREHWAKNSVEYVASKGILSGTGGGKFSPNARTTKAMVVTALGRISGDEPERYKSAGFADVGQHTYYYHSVNWAAHHRLAEGANGGSFVPGKAITREQMAVMLKRFVEMLGVELEMRYEQKDFVDDSLIASDAKEAVRQMQRAGIMSGRVGEHFDPQGAMSRAEFAAVLERLIGAVDAP